mgnify:FL=1
MKRERLDKILSHHGFGSRKDVKKLLHSGRVNVNGKICTLPDVSIDLDIDVISIDDEVLKVRKHVYLMMNKCEDVVCSNKDGIHSTVFDLVPEEYKTSSMGGELHCVGRLDIDTEGLLLLTTDGSLTHKLISPKTHIPKTYHVKLQKGLSLREQTKYTEVFQKGMFVPAEGNESEFTALPAQLIWPSEENGSYLTENGPESCEVLITIYEGKYHQVKRMFAACGNQVIKLKRLSIGDLFLDSGLALGQCRELTQEELKFLR